jgi:hypothetical protein
MNQLHEIYSHLIGRFPQCCPLSEQEQAVLTQLCQKLNKFFSDGKQIKQILDAQPALGKQTLMQNRIGGATSAQYAVRDWILPFMIQVRRDTRRRDTCPRRSTWRARTLPRVAHGGGTCTG